MRFHTAVNKFCWQAVMGTPVTVWKTALHQNRPYLYLGDGVRSIAHMIESKIYTGEIFNVVSGTHTVADVLDTIKITIPSLKIELVDHQVMNQLSYEASVQKFLKTGFQFKGILGTGVAETLQLLRNANM
jgi:UDP-glucose 4-epimerase